MKKRDRKAQITVFMILGLLILFTALFVVILSMSVKKSSLQGEQEKILTQVFKKEALRVYVEDCLKDNMEEGIELLAKQGRIWNDQPGGSEEFIEDVSGVSDGKDRIYYGITRKLFKEINAFPCKDDTNDPMFCEYSYPGMAEFGQLKLKKDVIFQKDLKNFLINRTVWCVENFTKSNISKEAQVDSTNLDLSLEETDEGINVLVNYPLKIKLNKEELFHLTKFDFFYPTKFKQVLDVAMIYPLQWDQKFVDFSYNDSSLNADYFEYNSSTDVKENCELNGEGYFTCKRKTLKDKYQALEMKMQKENISGDDIFVFSTPMQNVFPDSSGQFKLQIARQNRPPALDYVHRENCSEKGYDYLVIPGDEILGNIDINLSAHDADEDKIMVYRFDSVGQLVNAKEGLILGFVPNGDYSSYFNPKLFIDKLYFTSALGIIKISANVLDEHGLPDYQEVRILIDKPMETKFSISGPYKNMEGTDYYKNGEGYIISKEDPVYLNVEVPFPENSESTASASLNYNVDNKEKFVINIAENKNILDAQGKGCFNIPEINNQLFFSSGGESCNLDSYQIDTLDNTKYFKDLTTDGLLKISQARTYCNDDKKESSMSAKVKVMECVPYVNPTHPYPYIPSDTNYQLIFEKDAKGNYVNTEKKDGKLNPFLATHSCCDNDWKLINKDISCFTDLKPSSCIQDVYLAQKNYVCDGVRGNICGAGGGQNILFENKLICGDNYISSTCETEIVCKGLSAFDFFKDTEGNPIGLCSGKGGCTDICDKPVVDLTNKKVKQNYNLPNIARELYINSPKLISLSMLQINCGCDSNTLEYPCDSNYDGTFDGKCDSNNKCVVT